ncbi:hypothetical protein [Parafrankia sp. FMc2]|uniref:hypothetical protein n=1 Tax=Parafrankia sp. FMc2 TaxID=3233196 RepID=UPI0034D6A959
MTHPAPSTRVRHLRESFQQPDPVTVGEQVRLADPIRDLPGELPDHGGDRRR